MSDLKQVYRDHTWYTQGIEAVPMMLSVSAMSGFTLNQEDKELDYKHFLFRYDGRKAEMLYDSSELKRLWDLLRPRLIDDPLYLKKICDKYDKNFATYKEFFPPPSKKQLVELSDKQLIKLFHTTVKIQCDSVGLGHVIEPISIVGTDYIYERIKKEAGEKKNINELISDLFEPSQKSFLSVEERELEAISSLPSKEQEKQLIEHQKKYYWIENTYWEAESINIPSLRERMSLLKENSTAQKADKSVNKIQLMEELDLSEDTKKLVEALNFCTVWQDDRKINILKSISLTDTVIEEVARRTGIDSLLIKYLGGHEVGEIRQTSELLAMEDELRKRSEMCYYYLKKGEDIFSDHATFKEISAIHHPENNDRYTGDIRGMSACQGVAIAKVRVCTDMEAISNFPEGAVLVTHMTRPEYVSAMKKASAIVTDEGGITSHAAIVSRELGIPCIIGTQNATKLLKNGDMVEVRANHGFVRVIK